MGRATQIDAHQARLLGWLVSELESCVPPMAGSLPDDSLWDAGWGCSRPGRDCRTYVTHSKKKKEGQGGLLSCMAFNPDRQGLLAVGSYNRTTGIYNSGTRMRHHASCIPSPPTPPLSPSLITGGWPGGWTA